MHCVTALSRYIISRLDNGEVIIVKNLRQGLIRQKYWQVWNRTQSDPEYARMFVQMA